MEPVLPPPKSYLQSSDPMSTATTTTVQDPLIGAGTAANADQLGEGRAAERVEPSIEATGGWDAYEVWRRFIKTPRDRRKLQGPN
jgi:hypothetical protein